MNKFKSVLNKYGLEIAAILLCVLMMLQFFQYATLRFDIGDFIIKGARFTAEDGKMLCERIKVLEKMNNLDHMDCIIRKDK